MTTRGVCEGGGTGKQKYDQHRLYSFFFSDLQPEEEEITDKVDEKHFKS